MFFLSHGRGKKILSAVKNVVHNVKNNVLKEGLLESKLKISKITKLVPEPKEKDKKGILLNNSLTILKEVWERISGKICGEGFTEEHVSPEKFNIVELNVFVQIRFLTAYLQYCQL